MSEKKILVVDDDPVTIAIAKKILRENYEVQSAADGEEALELLSLDRMDLVISDIHMPKLDGFALLEKVRAFSPRTPVIIMTKFSDTKNIRRCWKLGAFDLVEKPLESLPLNQTVTLAFSFGEDWPKNTQIIRRPLNDDYPVLDKDKLFDLLENDLEAIREVLSAYERSAPLIVAALLRDFDPAESYKRFSLQLHKLDGMAAAIQGLALKSACHSVEESIRRGEVVRRTDLDVITKEASLLQTKVKEIIAGIPQEEESDNLLEEKIS